MPTTTGSTGNCTSTVFSTPCANTVTRTSSLTPTTSNMPSHTPSPTSSTSPSETPEIIPEDGSDVIELEFTSSSEWDIPKDASFVDVFLVGGGGGGGQRGGGGGGYTQTYIVDVRKLEKALLTLGEGGNGNGDDTGEDGGTTQFQDESGKVNLFAKGGQGGDRSNGGSGGSGGGGGTDGSGCGAASAGNGGSDGSDGQNGHNTNGGTGQRFTTKAFGYDSGELFSGGGAGGNCVGHSCRSASGGNGGGANSGDHAPPNKGGGGGAGAGNNQNDGCGNGGNGGSGIIRIRYKTSAPIQQSPTPQPIPCIHYDSAATTYYLSCSFNWTEYRTVHDFLTLKRNEVFDGRNYRVDLVGVNEWTGLFRIDESGQYGPTSLEDAPTIRRLHLNGGKTIPGGGFIVGPRQKHFTVESCSTSGYINGTHSPSRGGGGICGEKCSGEILIADCLSTGKIDVASGGIMGSNIGFKGGWVNITRSRSTGAIFGAQSGGICGSSAGSSDGKVLISYSYSTGDIFGSKSGGLCGHKAGERHGAVYIHFSSSSGRIGGAESGGLCGRQAGHKWGMIRISQSYSLGEISGLNSGGILGRETGSTHGNVTIHDCYTRGDISGELWSGGICGFKTGSKKGSVLIENAYSSGHVKSSSAGGLIGHTASDSHNIIIHNCVYNGGPMISTDDFEQVVLKHNSNSLTSILGQIYCPMENNCWDTSTIWRAVPDDVPRLHVEIAPSATPSVTPSTSPSPSSSVTETVTPSSSASSSSRPKRVSVQQLPLQRPRRCVK